jgi:hypothetical protein
MADLRETESAMRRRLGIPEDAGHVLDRMLHFAGDPADYQKRSRAGKRQAARSALVPHARSWKYTDRGGSAMRSRLEKPSSSLPSWMSRMICVTWSFTGTDTPAFAAIAER